MVPSRKSSGQQQSILDYLTPRKKICRKLAYSDSESETEDLNEGSSDEIDEENASALSTKAYSDIACYVQPKEPPTDRNMIYKLLQSPWKPGLAYKFPASARKQSFRLEWLARYKWMQYSKSKRGPFCRYCVLFRPTTATTPRRVFVSQPCTAYSRFAAACREHELSECHQEAVEMRESFLSEMQSKTLDWFSEQTTELRQYILSIATGTSAETISLFENLFTDQMRSHIRLACKQILVERKIVPEIKSSPAFALLVGRSVDIRGTENISIGIRYLVMGADKLSYTIREDFLGFAHVANNSAEAIADAILITIGSYGIEPSKLVAQCFSFESKAYEIIQNKYKLALLTMSTNHDLTHELHEGSSVPIISNTFSTVHEIIDFFRESALRRRTVPNLQIFNDNPDQCILHFKENFIKIVAALKTVSQNSIDMKARVKAYQLFCTAKCAEFIVALHIIAIYASDFENIEKKMHHKSRDVCCALKDMINLIKQIKANSTEEFFHSVAEDTIAICEELNIDCSLNPESETRLFAEIFKPYSDNLCACLQARFSKSHFAPYKLSFLHPQHLTKATMLETKSTAEKIETFYKKLLPNFVSEALLWFSFWAAKPETKALTVEDLFTYSQDEYPIIYKALQINLVLPMTWGGEDKVLSTIPNVEQWLLRTKPTDRTEEDCLLEVHRARFDMADEEFPKHVIAALQENDQFVTLLQKQLFLC